MDDFQRGHEGQSDFLGFNGWISSRGLFQDTLFTSFVCLAWRSWYGLESVKVWKNKACGRTVGGWMIFYGL